MLDIRSILLISLKNFISEGKNGMDAEIPPQALSPFLKASEYNVYYLIEEIRMKVLTYPKCLAAIIKSDTESQITSNRAVSVHKPTLKPNVR